MSRTAIATLSTEHLHHNIEKIRSLLPKSNIIAMVKANAYGHGIRSVGMRIQHDVAMLGVSSIDEAMILRQVGVKTPILLTQGLYEPRELVIASEEDFHVAFHHEAQLSWLANTSLKIPLHAWIKINTGMGRLGFSIEAAEKAYDVLMSHKNILKPVRILSHFACADNIYHPLNQQQINTFRAFIQDKSTEYSLCNSAGLLNFPTEAFDFVRPGILTYGISPLPNQTAASLGFKPVMTVHSTLMAVNQLKKGDTIGYDARFQCEENMPVGIIAFGYGDGYPPTALDNAPILVNGTRCQLIGKVSMDMIAVDLRLAPSAKMGDIVTLWGEDAPVEELTKHTYQNVWHIVTSVQHRVKFTWKD